MGENNDRLDRPQHINKKESSLGAERNEQSLAADKKTADSNRSIFRLRRRRDGSSSRGRVSEIFEQNANFSQRIVESGVRRTRFGAVCNSFRPPRVSFHFTRSAIYPLYSAISSGSMPRKSKPVFRYRPSRARARVCVFFWICMYGIDREPFFVWR